MTFGVAILAAGASRRMGRPKLTLPWDGGTILACLISTWQQLGAAQIAVVCAERNAEVAAELDRIGFPLDRRPTNPDPDRGMFSSVQCAARWNGWAGDLAHWILALGDQPQISPATLRTFLAHTEQNPGAICQPAFQNRARHPVALPRAALDQIASADPAITLKDILQTFPSKSLIEIPDPALAMDMDTPADYERLFRLLQPAASTCGLREPEECPLLHFPAPPGIIS